MTYTISRRTMLKTVGAASLATLIWPSQGFTRPGGTLVLRSYGDLQVLDPAYRVSEPDADIARCIFSGLVMRKSGDDWGWKPMGASSIDQLDEKTIRFTLRDDIHFSDGFGQATAEDVKFSIERIADPEMDSPYKDDWAMLDRVEIKDKLSGLIHLKKPFAPLWNSTLPGTSGIILSKKAVEAVGGRFETTPPGQSGPYLLKEWKPKQRTILEINPNWKGEKPAYDRIEILPIEDSASAERAFEAGDLDFTIASSGSVSRLRSNLPDNARLIEKPPLSYVWIGINQDAEPFDNPKIRRAMQHAIDRKMVVDAYTLGGAEISYGIIAPGLPGNRDYVRYDYDPEKAKQLIDEAGGINVPLSIDILATSEYLAAAQIIQANLAAIGVDLKINQHDSGSFWSIGSEEAGESWKTMQMFTSRFSMEPDPSWATVWFVPEQVGIWNWERWRSPEFARLHEQGLVEFDETKRDQIYKQMQDLMDESGSYIFLTHEVRGILTRDDVEPGLTPAGTVLYPAFRKA